MTQPVGSLFVSTELAGRIERVESSMLRGGALAAAERRPGASIYIQDIAGGVAIWTGPGSPLNKVAGTGFAGPLDPERLSAVEAAFVERGSPVQVELCCLGDLSIARDLTRRGYVLEGFENVLGRRLAAEEPARLVPGVVVSVSEPDQLDAWLDLVVAGFTHPDTQGQPSHEEFDRDAVAQVMGDLVSGQGFVRYLAYHEGVRAGGASMRLAEGVAQLCGAATLPERRRRGVQSALLATRLHEASRAGCDLAVVTTQPGSKSQQNVQKLGFELLYTRAILVRHLPSD